MNSIIMNECILRVLLSFFVYIMQDNEIDLNLARNYVPACFALTKTIALLLMLELLDAFHMENAITAVLMLVVIDRVYTKLFILDANAILMLITINYLSFWMHSSFFIWDKMDVIWYMFSALWVFFALYTQTIYGSIPLHNLKIFFVCTCLFISVIPFSSHHQQKEIYTWRVTRGLLFCVMSLIWVYVIGVYQHRMTKPAESGIHFVVYFSPCLFVAWSVAMAFCGSVFLVILWRYYSVDFVVSPKTELDIEKKVEEIVNPEIEELQLLLRQAMQTKNIV